MRKRIILAVATAAALAGPVAAQAFQAATIKPCGDGPDDRRIGDLFSGAKGTASTNRIDLACWTIKDLILSAYVRYANGRDYSMLAMVSMLVTGGEDWINFDRFTVEARAAGAPGQEKMRGPMMQALLEERFHLKIHPETREEPVLRAEGGRARRQPAPGNKPNGIGATDIGLRRDHRTQRGSRKPRQARLAA